MNTQEVHTSKQTNYQQEYVVYQQDQRTIERQQQYQTTNSGENEVVYRRQEVVVSQNGDEQIQERNGYEERDLHQSSTVNITPQRQNIQSQQMVENTTVSFNQQQNNGYITSSVQQNQNFTNELSKSQQRKTYYSGSYDEQCYLCQNGLHQAQDTQHQYNQQYRIQQTEVNQQYQQQSSSQQQQYQQQSLYQQQQQYQQKSTAELNNQNQYIGNDGKQTMTFYSDKYEDQCYLCQQNLHGVEDPNHSNFQKHQIKSTETNQQLQITQINQQNQKIGVDGQQTRTFYSDKYENQCYLCQNGLHEVQEAQNLNIQQHQIQQIDVNQQSQMLHQQSQVNATNGNQLLTFYSDKYENICYLCQHGLHGKEQNNVIRGQEVIISQTIGKPISSKKEAKTVGNFSQVLNTPVRENIYASQQVQVSPIQNVQMNVQSPQPIQRQEQQIVPQVQRVVQQQIPIVTPQVYQQSDQQISHLQQSTAYINNQNQYNDKNQTITFFSNKFEDQCYLCQQNLHGIEELNNSNNQQHQITKINQQNQKIGVDGQQTMTFYSDKYENQCYLCQNGLHGKEQNNVIRGQEVIISQTIGKPISSKKETKTVENFSQILNTPVRENLYASQQVQVSPIQNVQNVQMNVQSPQPIQRQEQQIVPQVQRVVQQQIPIVTPQVYQQEQQISQIKPLQYKQQIIQTPPQVIVKTQDYKTAPLYEKNIIKSQYSPIQQQKLLQQSQLQQEIKIETNQQQVVQMTAQEQVEQYWRFKVYELQERVYELMNEINIQKQQNIQSHQRTGSQVKKNTEDIFKQEQLQKEIKDLEKQLQIKQKRTIDIRNNLNYLIQQRDPTEDATKYKEQELQQLRQRYNTLNFKYQSNQEDIAMTKAVLDAIKSGKGYKIVREQQTISQSKQYSNNQSLRQG